MDNTGYQAQLNEKIARMNQSFAEFTPPKLEVFASPAKHYRMRAEFRVWHQDDDMYYVMFDQQTKQRYRVDSFPVASVLINELMPRLLNELKPSKILRHKLFQVDFLSTLSGEILISLLYHRQLDEEWQKHAQALKEKLNAKGYQLNLIGRARKQKILIDKE